MENRDNHHQFWGESGPKAATPWVLTIKIWLALRENTHGMAISQSGLGDSPTIN